jgi:hypothetical protein
MISSPHANLLLKFESDFEDATKPGREPKDRNMMVVTFTEGFGLTEAGVKVSENIDTKEQRAATVTQRKIRMLACLL